MYQSLLQDSRCFDLLLKLDEDLAAEARRAGCACGGALHSARYERKPRGGPAELGPESTVRFSFCCATEGCRRRVTPPSLRFLGRKVFFGVLVLLLPVLRDGATPERLDRLCQRFSVSVQTVRRWCRFWRETFVTSRVWQAARGGKQEAFWNPVEGRLLAMLEGQRDLTLALLNEATQAWVEMEYNREVHSEISQAPLARWLDGTTVGRESPTVDALRLAFTAAETRSQRRSDGTVSIEGVRFEIPARFRHLRKLHLRYASWDLTHVWLVDSAPAPRSRGSTRSTRPGMRTASGGSSSPRCRGHSRNPRASPPSCENS